MPSIHDILAGPNLPLYSSPVRGGTNTSDPVWTLVEKWTPWRDFTIENLTAMYASVLNAPWKDNLPNDVTAGFDQVIRDELSLTIFLAKYIWPAVNLALPQARSILRLGPEQLYLGTGSWCQQGRKVPDWGLALDQSGLSTGKFDNLLPGDTKLSAKWTPDMRHTNCLEWKLPISQLAEYAKQSQRRYGFIITDAALVVMRFTKEHIDDGLSATRPTRTVTQRHQPHQRTLSEETNGSSQPISGPNESFGAQSYDDNDSEAGISREMRPPEFAVIQMTDSGKDILTVKFALFCLCLMASSGCGDLDCMYPPFDSWRKDQQGPGYIHNTSNLVAKRLPYNAEIYETQD